MDYLSDDECHQIALRLGAQCRDPEQYVTTSRDIEAAEYDIPGPTLVGPGLPPEDASCGQFAVAFHVTTSNLAALKRIADLRGVDVPELCRQVIGVFVDQQEGDLSALLSAEAEAARPRLTSGYYED